MSRIVGKNAVKLLRYVSVLSIVYCAAHFVVPGKAIADADGQYREATPGPAAVEAIVLALGGAAEADMIVTQTMVGNTVIGNNVSETVEMHGSFGATTGIMQINQDAGTLANQANVLALAIGGDAAGTFVDAFAAYAVIYAGNTVNIDGGSYKNSIDGSFNGSSGIAQVNQNTGALNNQVNGVAIGIGPSGSGGMVALSDAVLSVYAADNEIDVDIEDEMETENSLTNSFNGFSGIAQVNQISGGVAVTAAQAININIIPAAAP